jgi:hypothetical protein
MVLQNHPGQDYDLSFSLKKSPTIQNDVDIVGISEHR